MLSKRIIACLDVRDGNLAKSIKFVDTKDIGDPIAAARKYYEQVSDRDRLAECAYLLSTILVELGKLDDAEEVCGAAEQHHTGQELLGIERLRGNQMQPRLDRSEGAVAVRIDWHIHRHT